MDFTPEQTKIIHDAVRYYQIHGVSFNGKEYKLCDDVLNKTFHVYFTEKNKKTNE
jgi:hypothetical protein